MRHQRWTSRRSFAKSIFIKNGKCRSGDCAWKAAGITPGGLSCVVATKGAWVPYGEPVTWKAGYVSTAVFWCLTTADALGPDDGFVHPHVGVTGRQCFCERFAIHEDGSVGPQS